MAIAAALVRSLAVRVYIPVLFVTVPIDTDALNVNRIDLAAVFAPVMNHALPPLVCLGS